jgi:hypothetical protein
VQHTKEHIWKIYILQNGLHLSTHITTCSVRNSTVRIRTISSHGNIHSYIHVLSSIQPMTLFIIIYHIPSITTHLGWLFTQHVSKSTMSSSGVYIFVTNLNVSSRLLSVVVHLFKHSRCLNFLPRTVFYMTTSYIKYVVVLIYIFNLVTVHYTLLA